MKKWIAFFSLVMVGASAHATSPIRPAYMYGAIAYQTIPASYYSPARYNVGTAGGYANPYDAAYEAQRDCGPGCGYFTWYNGCAGIAFTAAPWGNVANYGFMTEIVNYNGRGNRATRFEVERRLDRKCRLSGLRCVRTFTECSY